jgi:hypothetical protein
MPETEDFSEIVYSPSGCLNMLHKGQVDVSPTLAGIGLAYSGIFLRRHFKDGTLRSASPFLTFIPS